MTPSIVPYIGNRQRFASTVTGLFSQFAQTGDLAQLDGRDVAGDGGGQTLRYDAASTAPIDGGFTEPSVKPPNLFVGSMSKA